MGIREDATKGILGIEITKITSEIENHVLTRSERILFSMDKIEEYKENFMILIQENILIDGEYEGHLWTGTGNANDVNLKFEEFEYNRQTYEALKAFCILHLYHRRISIDTVRKYLNHTKRIINITKNFNEEYIQDLESFLDEYDETSALIMVQAVVHYLLFNPVNDALEYLTYLSNRPEWDISAEPRELPSATSVIVFSDIIENYMSIETDYNRIKFFPLYLWWRITSIIPMRPSEFLRIKRDCIFIEKNKYYIRIYRGKRPPNKLLKRKVIPVSDTIEINEEIFRLISEYIDISDIYDEKYLLALKVYTHNRKYKNIIEKNSRLKDRMGYKQLQNILDEFYDEVVKPNYNVLESKDWSQKEDDNSIMKLRLGDTRHFAFCSLMLQGFNPLSIAILGGHKSLDSQMNYHQHLDYYIECHTYLLKQTILKSLNSNTSHGINGNVKTSRELALQEYNEGIPLRMIDEGWCCSTNFPKECTSISCVRCSKFKLDMGRITNLIKDEIEKAEKELAQEIECKIGFVKRYFSATLSELNNDANDEEMKKDAISLSKSVKQNAKILAMKEMISEV